MNLKVRKSEELHSTRKIENLKEMLASSTQLYKDNCAFKYKKDGSIVEVTYEKFASDVNSLGTALLNLGLTGEKIALIGGNSYKWCVSYFATVCGIRNYSSY